MMDTYHLFHIRNAILLAPLPEADNSALNIILQVLQTEPHVTSPDHRTALNVAERIMSMPVPSFYDEEPPTTLALYHVQQTKTSIPSNYNNEIIAEGERERP